MMKAFNSLQITAAFAAAPFGLGWLANTDFPGHTPALWVGVIAYLFFFGLMTAATYAGIEKLDD